MTALPTRNELIAAVASHIENGAPLAVWSPPEVDTLAAEIDTRAQHAVATMRSEKGYIADAVCSLEGVPYGREGREAREEIGRRSMSDLVAAVRAHEPDGFLRNSHFEHEAKHKAASVELAGLQLIAADLNAAYIAGGRWARRFVVPGGHVHSSTYCSSCHRGAYRTELYWAPSLSGADDDAMIAEYGTSICTICYPAAPTMASFVAAEQALRDAKAAAPVIDDVTGRCSNRIASETWKVGDGHYGHCDACGKRAVSAGRYGLKLAAHSEPNAMEVFKADCVAFSKKFGCGRSDTPTDMRKRAKGGDIAAEAIIDAYDANRERDARRKAAKAAA